MSVTSNKQSGYGFKSKIKPSAGMSDAENQVHFERGSKEYQRGSLALFAAGLATFAVLYYVQPLFPIYSKEFGLSPAAVSLSLSISTGLLAISLPLAGLLSDRIGRKALMAISLIVSSVCCLCTTFAPNFTSLVIIRAVQGIVLAGVPAVAMTYLNKQLLTP